MSSLDKCLFESFAHFLIGLFVSLVLSFKSSLQILDINPFLDVSVNIFSHLVDCLFILLMVSFLVLCNKGCIWQTHCQHHIQWAKTINVSLKIVKTGMDAFTSLIQHSTGSPSDSNQIRRNKRHPNCEERSKTALFADDMILYIENPEDSTKGVLELINKFRE